jgi:hypothetical protein
MAAAPRLAWPTEIRAPHPTTTCACLPLRGDGHRKESSPRPGPPPRPHLSAGCLGPNPHTHPASQSLSPPRRNGRCTQLLLATGNRLYISEPRGHATERRAVQAKHSHASCSLLASSIVHLYSRRELRLFRRPAGEHFASVIDRRARRTAMEMIDAELRLGPPGSSNRDVINVVQPSLAAAKRPSSSVVESEASGTDDHDHDDAAPTSK